MANVRSLSTTAENEWSPKLTSIFSNGEKTLADVQQVVEDVRAFADHADNLGDSGESQRGFTAAELNDHGGQPMATYRPTDKEYSKSFTRRLGTLPISRPPLDR